MRRLALMAAVLAGIAAAAFWWLTRPDPLDAATLERLEALDADPARGAGVFWAGGCAACHIAADAEDTDRPVLSGGQRFDTPFGSFLAPNISPDTGHGIGGWTQAEFANAMLRGISPAGQHYYPAFPYPAYLRATLQDVADLQAFIETLPESDTANRPHDLGFPFSVRRGLGLWKRLNMDDGWVMADAPTPELERGRYLVEALAHCAECHTPRDRSGGLDRAQWMRGAPNPAGRGRIPDITPGGLGWSAEDIALYLDSGFTPTFDVAGGSMAAVVRAMARLEPADRAAIAAYLLALD
ncbi:MAG: cytochrome c [Rhodobacteraceae bacterium]|nr:cytochrome c [Paracoccaceae bacterium]